MGRQISDKLAGESDNVEIKMRIGAVRMFVATLLIGPCAIAQSTSGATEAPDPIAAACPHAAAFVKHEKERRAAIASRSEAPPTQPALKQELKDMTARDQEARTAYFNHSPNAAKAAAMKAIDAANLKRLKEIVAQFGFPTTAMVGREGMENAWLLTQHADTDVAFQKQVIAVLKSRPENEVRQDDLAMLEDRIRVNEGKPQRYGGNFDLKTMQPTPIEDPQHVDERRARVHLMPLADYRCAMKEIYRLQK